MAAVDVATDLVRWRRHLHANPELSYQEDETSRFVEETLREFGGPSCRGRRRRASSPACATGDGPTLALRADMDALPIQEESGLEFASTRPGVMHACGHDGHTAILLGVARCSSSGATSSPARCDSCSSTPRSCRPAARAS